MRAEGCADLSGRWAELRALRVERDEFKSAYLAVRDAMDSERAMDKRRLRLLVVQSEDAVRVGAQRTTLAGKKSVPQHRQWSAERVQGVCTYPLWCP